jgi:3-dehydroquinate dehydratase-2
MKQKTKKKKRILVIHGPNLNLLGVREPQVYGKVTLKQINDALNKIALRAGILLTIEQSNQEGDIVDLIGQARHKYDAILINPAAYTHTSVAIRDALAAVGVPAIEVHLSNIYAREGFRHKSLISPVVTGSILGFGPKSYTLGLEALIALLDA